MKTLSLIGRRDDYSHEQFRRYYEEQHAPLAIRSLDFERYVRNYTVRRSASLPAFDVLPEFEFADFSRVGEVLATPAGQTIRADEANFMGAVRHVAMSQETVVADGDRSGARTAIFLRRMPAGADPDLERIQAWAKGFVTAGARTTIDLLTHFPDKAFPADAIVSFWGAADPSRGAPDGYERLGDADLVVSETPVADLKRAPAL